MVGRRRGHPAGRGRALRPGHQRARRASCPGWPWRRARSARRRSATGARSAATSARPPRPATPIRRCWPATPWSRRRRCAAPGGIPIREFYTGVKRSALAADELIAAIRSRWPTARSSSRRSACATRWSSRCASFAIALHPGAGAGGHRVRFGRPDPRPAAAAEDFLGAELADRGLWDSRGPLAESAVRRFGDLVAAGGRAHRRRARHRRLPAACAGRAGPPDAGLGLAVLPARSARDAGDLHGQRLARGRRRRVGGRVAAVRAARAARPAGLEERLRAGRMRLLHGATWTTWWCAPAWSPPGRPQGRDVRTVEGIAGGGGTLGAVQQAFLDAGAVQCGFCTPGLIVATDDLLRRSPAARRRRDPRGAGGQPVPLHRLREDPRRRPAGGAPSRRGAR